MFTLIHMDLLVQRMSFPFATASVYVSEPRPLVGDHCRSSSQTSNLHTPSPGFANMLLNHYSRLSWGTSPTKRWNHRHHRSLAALLGRTSWWIGRWLAAAALVLAPLVSVEPTPTWTFRQPLRGAALAGGLALGALKGQAQWLWRFPLLECGSNKAKTCPNILEPQSWIISLLTLSLRLININQPSKKWDLKLIS